MERLYKTWETAKEAISQTQKPKRNGFISDLDEELKTIKRRKVAKRELDIEDGERSIVCLFPSSSHRNYL